MVLSTEFGTKSIVLQPEDPTVRRSAVLALCWFARDRGPAQVRELLAAVGLDPHEGKGERRT